MIRILSDFFKRPVKAPTNLESFARNIPRICIVRGGIWKGNILADIEELEEMDASEIPS